MMNSLQKVFVPKRATIYDDVQKLFEAIYEKRCFVTYFSFCFVINITLSLGHKVINIVIG